MLEEEGILPHIPVFDKSKRKDGAFPATDFVFNHAQDEYICPGGNRLKKYWRKMSKPRTGISKDGFIRY